MTAVDTDTERTPRALTDQERRRLVYAFRPRPPLAEYGRETVTLPPDKRKGRRMWSKARLTLDNIAAAAAREVSA